MTGSERQLTVQTDDAPRIVDDLRVDTAGPQVAVPPHGGAPRPGIAGTPRATDTPPATRPRHRLPWLVVDAAVLAVALTDDGPDGDRVRQRLAGCRLAAPSTVDLELLAIWRRGTRTGAIPQRRVDLAMVDLARLPLTRVAPIDVLVASWHHLDAVTTGDAPYLALAEALDAAVLTADPLLAGRAPQVRVELVR